MATSNLGPNSVGRKRCRRLLLALERYREAADHYALAGDLVGARAALMAAHMAAHESLDWKEQGPFVKRGQGLQIQQAMGDDNELESFFRTLKWHQRRVQGKKSTAGGLLESFAPLLVQLWPMLKRRPDLQALFEGLSYEEIQSLQERITSLSEPARARRSFRRDSDTQLEQALAKWSAE